VSSILGNGYLSVCLRISSLVFESRRFSSCFGSVFFSFYFLPVPGYDRFRSLYSG